MRIKPVPTVNGIILDEKKRVLLTQRSREVREPGKWCLPGGHLDGGEDWITALRREMLEETGLRVTSEVLIGIYSSPELTTTPQPLADGSHVQFVTASFLITSYEGELKPNHEVSQCGWFELSALPDPILKSHPIRIQDAIHYEGRVFVR